MFREQSKSPRTQRGSMLLISIFVIVVLSALAITMTQMLQDNARSMVFEVFGARTFNAANSGAQRALNEVLGPGASNSCSAANICPEATAGPYNFPAVTAFSGCQIKSVSCLCFDISETGYRHFQITSAAQCGEGEFITERSVAVEARVRN